MKARQRRRLRFSFAAVRKGAWVQISIIVVCAVTILLVGIRIGYILYKPKTSVVTANEAVARSPISNSKKPASQSMVCKQVSTAAVSQVTRVTINEAYASVPDTTTNEGMVSGCTYTAADGQDMKGVTVVSRNLKSNQAAQNAFERLLKNRADKLPQNNGQAYQLQDFQAIKISDTKLVTVTLIGAGSKEQAKQWLSAVANLF